ncbi:MAG: hypothetical protein IJ703_04285 [Eubacterium sp.]|nr:hypothetical protein [Eubacterium sp.]
MPGGNNEIDQVAQAGNELRAKMEALVAKKDAKGFAKLMIDTNNEYVSSPLLAQGQDDPVAEKKDEVLKTFLREITATLPLPQAKETDENGNIVDFRPEIKPETRDFVKDLIREMNYLYFDAVYKNGKQREAWEKKIKKGEVPDTELVKDEPDIVKKLAHAITIEADPSANIVMDAFRMLYGEVKGKKIDGTPCTKYYGAYGLMAKADTCSKNGISKEKLDEYDKYFGDRSASKSIGYKVVPGGPKEGEPLFRELPHYLPTVRQYQTEEEFLAREEELLRLIEIQDRLEQQVKSAVKAGKVLLDQLDKLNAMNEGEIEQDNLDTREYLEKFTHLGTDYKYKNYDVTEHIGVVNVKDATDNLKQPARDFREICAGYMQQMASNGTLDSREGRYIEKLSYVAEKTFYLNDIVSKRNIEYEKTKENPGKRDGYVKELYFLNKQMRLKGFFGVHKLPEDAHTKEIDKTVAELSDSVAADCLDDKCYDDLIFSMKMYKRTYQKMKQAEKEGNVDAYDKYKTLLSEKAADTKEKIAQCKTYESGENVVKRNITGETQLRGKLFDNIGRKVSKKFDKPPMSYESYIYLHVGKHSGNTENDMRDNIAKVLAAYSLQKMGEKFDVGRIHEAAKHITELYILDNNNAYIRGMPRLQGILKDKDSVLKEGEKLRCEIYDIKNDQYDAYVNDMTILKESLRSADGRSKEYKALVNIITEASELGEKTKNMSAAKKAAAFRQANIDVIYAVQKYVKGKEKVRISDKGNDAFANSMDALSIVSKYTKKPGSIMNQRVINVVYAINKIRKQEGLDIYTAFESDYGAARAKQAADERRVAQNSNKKTADSPNKTADNTKKNAPKIG